MKPKKLRKVFLDRVFTTIDAILYPLGMKKRVVIAVGGTGGHIFPSLAFAEELVLKAPEVEICFAGKGTSQTPHIQGFDKHEIPSGTLGGKNPVNLIKGMIQIGKGVIHSKKLLQSLKPDAVVGFGSYHSLPILVAAKMEKIPIFLHEQNSAPGRVNRLISPFAKGVAIQFPNAKLSGKTQIVKSLIRNIKEPPTKEDALDYFGLQKGVKTILIFGGSQGALAINTLIKHAAHHFGNVQFIHLTGKNGADLKAHYRQKKLVACVKEFEDRMEMAWSAADLVICRSGAGTVAEMLHYQVPGILIPYPFAKDNHQESNADFVVSLGGAVKLIENKTSPSHLSTLVKLMLDDTSLANMREALKKHQEQASKLSFADLLLEHWNG